MQIDIERHQELERMGLLSMQQHPTLPLLIHNYTQRCQWEKAWNETSLQCRGLITDLSGNVVCRPFPKFFNLSEHTAAGSKLKPINWRQNFSVSEKLDGSLGIAYYTPDGMAIATRGSFVSDQAKRATQMLRSRQRHWLPEWTYLFEIIYPANRIVVNYGDTEDLVLLEMVHTASGKAASRSILETEAKMSGWTLARHYEMTAEQLQSYSDTDVNREGVVVRFEDGTRIKIKLEEYCRLHRLITGVNAKHVWELLSSGKSIDELIDRVPDEFMEWVRTIERELQSAFHEIQIDAMDLFRMTKATLGNAGRKSYAEVFKNYSGISSILFLMLDGRDYSPAIWKKLKPETSVCFAANE